MSDAVVLVIANTLTPSSATRLGKIMSDVRKYGDLWWWYAGGAGGDIAVGGSKADKGRGRGFVKEPSAGAWPRRWQYDVSAGRDAGSLRQRCGGSHGFRRSWCGTAAHVCQNVLGSFLTFLMIARRLVAASFFVTGESSGK